MTRYAPRKGTPRRCDTCAGVTSRYAGTRRQGAVTLRVWERTELGQVVSRDDTRVWCAVHAPKAGSDV